MNDKRYAEGFELGTVLPSLIPHYDLDFMEGLLDALCGVRGAAMLKQTVAVSNAEQRGRVAIMPAGDDAATFASFIARECSYPQGKENIIAAILRRYAKQVRDVETAPIAAI